VRAAANLIGLNAGSDAIMPALHLYLMMTFGGDPSSNDPQPVVGLLSERHLEHAFHAAHHPQKVHVQNQ